PIGRPSPILVGACLLSDGFFSRVSCVSGCVFSDVSGSSSVQSSFVSQVGSVGSDVGRCVGSSFGLLSSSVGRGLLATAASGQSNSSASNQSSRLQFQQKITHV